MRLQLSDFQHKLVFSDHELTMACCGRGTGKSEGVVCRLAYRNVNFGRSAMLVAPTFGMIKDTLMPGILKWFEKFHVKTKVNWSEHIIETRYGRIVLLSGTRPDSPRGYTNLEDFYGDEAAYLSKAVITNGILACRSNKGLSSTQCFTSTGRVGSYFNKMFKRPSIKDHLLLTASTFDNPFTSDQYKRIAYESLMDTPELLKQEIGGGLDSEELNLVFPPSSFSRVCRMDGGRARCGIDFAYEGCDSTCITVVNDSKILESVLIGKDDGTAAFDNFYRLHQKYNFEMVSLDHTGGFDAGFLILMKAHGVTIQTNLVNFGAGATESKYANMRAQIYFNARKMIAENGFYIDRDEYEDELVPQTYFINTSGKIQLTPKKILKLQIGKSPDLADSLALALYKPQKTYTITAPQGSAPATRRH